MDKRKLVEAITFEGVEFTEADGVTTIKNVALLGGKSKHGYRYTEEAMQRGVPLYSGARCFINHPNAEETTTGRRDLMKLAGVVRNPVFSEGRVKGDIVTLPDEFGRKFANIARHMPEAASCSHVADGKLVKKDGELVVESIDSVLSVDLVVQGATTTNVFESEDHKPQVRSIAMEYSEIAVDELKIRRPDIVQFFAEEAKKPLLERITKLEEDNSKLTAEVDAFTKLAEGAKREKAIRAMIEESELKPEQVTDLFVDTCTAIEGEKWEEKVKALIEDRVSIFADGKPKGGVTNMPPRTKTGPAGNRRTPMSVIEGLQLVG